MPKRSWTPEMPEQERPRDPAWIARHQRDCLREAIGPNLDLALERKPPGKALTEADVTRQIRDVLRACRIFHWKQWQGPMSQPKGVADILGVFDGKLLAIEIKKPGGRPSPDQVKFVDRINSEGGVAFVAYSVEDVIEQLNLQCRLTPLFL